MNNMKLSIRNLSQNYGGEQILKKVSLDVVEGETLVVLGPSGCGKTSLLKSIAGLVPIDGGELLLDGSNVESLPPQSRKTALIFQNYALFPHMTVEENLAYGLTVKKGDKKTDRKRIEAILSMLKLEGLKKRPVTALSGGQQQRVAIGRAMIIEPSVLLFDEPLSNLDENLRKRMRNEIRAILKEANVTSLYVTHDQNEALAMADRIVVMREGVIEQIAPPSELRYKPRNEYVARFLGYGNILSPEWRDGRPFLFGELLPAANFEEDKGASVLVRPEDIQICDESRPGDVTGTVLYREIQASTILYRVKTAFGDLDVSVLNRRDHQVLDSGDSVILRFEKGCYHYLLSDGRELL